MVGHSLAGEAGLSDAYNYSASSGKYSLKNLWLALKSPHDTPPPFKTPLIYPPDWRMHDLQHNYMYAGDYKTTDVSISPARNVETPKGIIFYSLGWKTKTIEKKDIIEDFQNNGYTVLTLPLVEAGKRLGTMEENIERVKQALFKDESSLRNFSAQEYGRDDLPFFVVTHSSSANVYEHALQRAKTDYGFDIPWIDHVFHTAPFINAQGASKTLNPLGSLIYEFHAKRHLNEYTGESLMDRLFYFKNGLTARLLTEDMRSRPTHGQNLEIASYGDMLLDRESCYDFAEHSNPPETVFNSLNDDFSSRDVAALYYGRKNAELHDVTAGHSPLLLPQVREVIINKMDGISAEIAATHDLDAEEHHAPHFEDFVVHHDV